MSTFFTGDFTPTFFHFRHTVFFQDVKLSLVGHMESFFVAFDETSMCMSTACDVHSSGGFDASGRNVQTRHLLSSSGFSYAFSVVNLLNGVGTMLPLKRPTSPCWPATQNSLSSVLKDLCE